MWRLPPVVAFLLALLPASAALADRVLLVPVPVEMPERIDVGSQHYPVTPLGLRRYLERIRDSEPQLWRRLDPEVARLEARDSRSLWLGFGGLLLGGALAAGGLFAIDGGHDTAGDVLAIGGLAVTGAGIISFLVIRPERADVIEVMNLHNRLGPEDPMRLSSRGGLPRSRWVHLTVASF
jgi:hypothetical protein